MLQKNIFGNIKTKTQWILLIHDADAAVGKHHIVGNFVTMMPSFVLCCAQGCLIKFSTVSGGLQWAEQLPSAHTKFKFGVAWLCSRSFNTVTVRSYS